MAKREFLDPSITANSLVADCRRMTALQKADYLRPLLGKWLRIRGPVLAASDNRPLAGFGVTVIVADPASAIDVFCAFYGDYERLALVTSNDVVEVEGVLLEVQNRTMKLDGCAILDTRDGSRVSHAVTRDEHLRSILGAIPNTYNAPRCSAKAIEGLSLQDAATALHKMDTSVEIASGLVEVRTKVEMLDLSNFEKSIAQSYINILIEVAQMPEPDVSIFWLALERANSIAGIASLVVSVFALFHGPS
jgi:hypothetical protein